MEEWIISDFEQEFDPDKDMVWGSCAMDWQPEMTLVIPQPVDILYPWDAPEEAKERWRRKEGRRM